MKKLFFLLAVSVILSGINLGVAKAALITFDSLVMGQTSFGFDGDGDSLNDVIFSTTDPLGFNTIGPGLFMTHINEPGLEGTSLLNPDLRVDFLVGATGFLNFGFALNSVTEDDTASFSVFDASNNLLASSTLLGFFTLPDSINQSSFPEGYISTTFPGVASYATFDFTSDFGRYIIDNFEGNFGTTERVPEPATLLLLGSGFAVMAMIRRKFRA